MLYKSKNRTFNYTPRFSKKDRDELIDDASFEKDFVSKWKGVHDKNRKSKMILPISTLIVLLVLLLIGLYVLDSYIK